MTEASVAPYQRLSIYQTKARLYVVGYCKLRGTAALLKISKQEPTQLDVAEVAGNYSLAEVRAMLSQIHMANAHLGGLQLVTHCCGILGCFRFTETFYLLLVTRKAHVGSLCGHKVYTVAATALVPLHPGYHGAAGQPTGAAEKRYVKLLMGMDLTKHFYFSYTYRLSHTVQQNCRAAQMRGEAAAAAQGRSPDGPPVFGEGGGASPPHLPSYGPSSGPSDVYDSMFTWNAYLTSALRRALGGNLRWTVPLVHGFWEQRRLSIYGRPLTLTLFARRSRHFAGTRFRKRGINDAGRVANEVETEQVVDAGVDYRTRTPLLSSVVQVRGSVPLFWSQQLTALSPKPEIILQQFDPLYEVTQAHFDELESRYGAPSVVLNLLKSKERRPREVLLRRELATAIAQLNAQRGRSRPHIVYIPWDFSKHAKQSGANLLTELAAITRLALDMTGVFVHNPAAAATASRRPAAAPSPLPITSGGGGGGGGGGRGAAMLRATGAGAGSQLHLAAAADAADAAVRARKVAAAASLTSAAAASSAGHQNPDRDGGGVVTLGGVALSKAGAAAAAAGGGASGRPSFDQVYCPAGSGGGAAATSAGTSLPYPYTRGRRSGSFNYSAASATAAAAGGGGSSSALQWQSGVLRTNCIDCLDRTNVAQFAFGLVSFGRQLYKLGLHDVRDIDADSSAAFTLMALYEAMGHVLSLQYGGSEAHTIFFQRKKGEWEASMHSKDIVTSIKRLYSNTYTDAEKQDAINLFLGNFVPQPGQPHLWQLDTDQYLHSETTLRSTPSLSQQAAVVAAAAASAAAAAGGGGGGGGGGPVHAGATSGGGAPPPAQQQQLPTSRPCSDHQAPAAVAAAAAAVAAVAAAAATPSVSVGHSTPSVVIASLVSAPTAATSGSVAAAEAAAAITAIAAAATAAAAGRGGGYLLPGLLPAEAALPLDISSDDDDDDVRSQHSYHATPAILPDSAAGPSGSGGSVSAAASYAAYSSAAIPFHRAPSSGSFLSSLLPSFGGSGGGQSGGGGGGFFERVVASLLTPGGAGAAARSAAAGLGGGEAAPGSTAQLLLSFDVALARQPNQVWPIRLHGEEDKQGRATWTAVQSAFSFFWTSNAAGGPEGGVGGPRNNYQLDDAPRPGLRPPPPAVPPVNRGPSGRLLPAASLASPTSFRSFPSSALAAAPSGLTSLPMSPEPSRHGGNAAYAAEPSRHGGTGGGAGGGTGGGAVARTTSAVTDGGVSVLSDGGGLLPGAAAVAAAAAAAVIGRGTAAVDGRGGGRHLGMVLGAMVDTDHMDEQYEHGTSYRTVADTIPALGGGLAEIGRVGGGGGAGGDDDDGAYYYSLSDAEAAAAGGQAEGGGGTPVGARQGVRAVAHNIFGGGLLSPDRATGGGGGGGAAPVGKSAIPVLNDFIEVSNAGGGGGNNRDEHTLDPAVRRRAAADAAARAREEERQRKLLTAGLEVSDMLGLGVEDLGLNWELQPWWGMEPRPRYTPRNYEPHPSRLRAAREEAEAAAAEAKGAEAEAAEARRRERQQRHGGGADLLSFSDDDDGGGAAKVAAANTGTAVAAIPPTLPHASYRPYIEPPARVLAAKQRVEQMAFLHFDVAQLHARAKFGDFLGAVHQPYGLCGEERRREVAAYDAHCYIERL